MNAIASYLKERFPVPVVLVLSFATALMLIGVSKPSQDLSLIGTWAFCLQVTLVVFFFLLRTRITDEFKDSGHDDENYPNRPVQRGLISKETLKTFGSTAFTIELVLAFMVSIQSLTGEPGIWYLVILIYSALTAKEFFISEWLNQHFNLYFVLHQLIFVWFAIWMLSIHGADLSLNSAASVLAFTLFMASVEIARKYELRRSPAGEVVMDTYLAVWGRTRTQLVTGTITLLGSLLLWIGSGSILLWIIEAAFVTGMMLLRGKDSAVRGLIFLNFFAQAIVVFSF